MKSIFTFVSTIVIAIVLLTWNTVHAYTFETNFSNNIIVDNQTKQPDVDHVTHLQTKGQVDFFRQALDELGATSPEQVVKLWVKAEQTRNGVFHYAVACEELKSKIIKEWGEPQENFWIYGGSSPWLDRYEIVSSQKLNNSSYQIKIKFFWTTSTGPSEPTENTLVIVKNKDIWCVKEVK
jgi:hypothetical protein